MWNSTPVSQPDSPLSGDSLAPTLWSVTRFSLGLGCLNALASRRVLSAHSGNTTRTDGPVSVYWLEMTTSRVRSVRMIQKSGNMLVCSLQQGCVWTLKCVSRQGEKASNFAPCVLHEGLDVYAETCPVFTGVIDYGGGNGSDSRHHVFESHQRNNCWGARAI